MRKILVIILILMAIMGMAEIPHRYYVDRAEVDSAFWQSIPYNIRKQCASGNWEYDSVIIESLNLPIEYFIDSVSGNHIIKRRSDEKIDHLKEQLMMLSRQSSESIFQLHIGDNVPNFTIVKNPGGMVIENVMKPGKCYLINFWATWCGNCLLELLPSEIPLLAEKFIDDKDFVFLPICIDSTLSDLNSFFNSESGKRWRHLEYVTTLDIDRRANSLFAEAGHLPLTIVVGKDRKIIYSKIGIISTTDQFHELESAITVALSAK